MYIYDPRTAARQHIFSASSKNAMRWRLQLDRETQMELFYFMLR